MHNSFYERCLALAGTMQSAVLVHQLAREGSCAQAAFTTSINSLYQLHPDSVLAVYGDETALHLGYHHLLNLLQAGLRQPKEDVEINRYFFNLFYLERRLAKDHAMLNTLAKEMEDVNRQLRYFSPTHPTIIARLADIYLNTISTFRYRLHIVGKIDYLQKSEILNQIRALLLAGIRSAMLWRQLGGSRWQLFFKRHQLITIVKRLHSRN